MSQSDCPVADLLTGVTAADFDELLRLRDAAKHIRHTQSLEGDSYIDDRMLALIDLVGTLRFGSQWRSNTMVFNVIGRA